MPLIRLTQKLQKEIGLKPSDLPDLIQNSDPLTEWYAHIYLLDRSKQLIFVESQTFFSFSIPNVSRNDIRYHLPDLFIKFLRNGLNDVGAKEETTNKIIELCSAEICYSNTNSRKIIGVMNDFIKHHKFGYKYQNQPAYSRDMFIREIPMRGFADSNKYKFPITEFSKAVKERYNIDFITRKTKLPD